METPCKRLYRLPGAETCFAVAAQQRVSLGRVRRTRISHEDPSKLINLCTTGFPALQGRRLAANVMGRRTV